MSEPGGVRPGIRRLFRLEERPAAIVREEMDDEIRLHLELRIEQLVREGYSPERARAEALQRFGGARSNVDEARGRLHEAARRREERMRMRDWIGSAKQDVIYALRTLRRSRGVSAVILITLALSIGATTAIFSIVNAVLLAPLPYANADRVVEVWNHWTGSARTWLAESEVADYGRLTGAFSQLAPFAFTAVNLTGSGEPERVDAGLISADVLDVLGVRPALGRNFTAAEDVPNGARVALVSDELWRRRFGGDPRVIGRTVQVDGDAVTVVGVLPRDFRLPTEFAGDHSELFLPLRLGPPNEDDRGSHYLRAVARLAPGATLASAERHVNVFLDQYRRDHPNRYNLAFGVTLVSAHDQMAGDTRPVLLVLLGAVLFVLLIACANIANLLLSRAEARQQEVAIRTALGAGRGRLARQLLTESLVLSCVGGAVGLALAVWGSRALAALDAAHLPRAGTVHVDARVLLFGVVVSVVTGVLFGLAPVAHALRGDLQGVLRQGRGTTSGGRGLRQRHALVIVQVALALISVAGAMLMARSFASLLDVSSGFQADHVLTMRLSPAYRSMSRVRAFYDQLVDQVRGLPGVHAAGATSALPLTGTIGDWGFTIEGRPVPVGTKKPSADWQTTTPGYFEAMRIPIVHGRAFTTVDRADGTPVVIVSRTTAERYWPGADAVGQRLRLSGSDDTVWRTVVGVAGDVKHNGLDQDTHTAMYLPLDQFPATDPDSAVGRLSATTLVVRTAGDPARAVNAVRAAIARLDPNLPVSQVRTLSDVVSASVETPRLAALVLSAFGILALVLATVGVYGVMAYWVVRRRSEIGIRIALGAARGHVVRLVVRQGAWPVVVGLALGIAIVLGGGRLLRSMLFGVSPTDGVSLAGAVVILAGIALMAMLVPARRAARVDPLSAVREE